MSVKREVDTTLARGIVGRAIFASAGGLRKRAGDKRNAYDVWTTTTVINNLDVDAMFELAAMDTNSFAASALKYLLLTAVYATGALQKTAEYEGHHLGWALENVDEVVAYALKDAPSWSACAPYLAIDHAHPGWLEHKIDSLAARLRISAIVAQPPIQSTYACSALRKVFGDAVSSTRVVPRGLDYDDVTAIGLESHTDDFMYVSPYVFEKTSGRRTVDVSAFVILSVSPANKARTDQQIVEALKKSGYMNISDLLSLGEIAPLVAQQKHLSRDVELAGEICALNNAATSILNGSDERLRYDLALIFFKDMHKDTMRADADAVTLLVSANVGHKVKLQAIADKVYFAEVLKQIDLDKLLDASSHSIADIARTIKAANRPAYDVKHYREVVQKAISEQKKRNRKTGYDMFERVPALTDLLAALR